MRADGFPFRQEVTKDHCAMHGGVGDVVSLTPYSMLADRIGANLPPLSRPCAPR
jgi:hypothetical protein